MQLPSPLISIAESAVQNAQDAGYFPLWPDEVAQQFRYVAGLSQFITEAIHRDEVLARELPSMLAQPSRQESYRSRLAELLEQCPDEMSGHRVLRQFRNREMVYIAWKDFTHAWSLETSLSHLSELAEAMIFETYQWQYQVCCQEWGTPTSEDGEVQPMLIIGMGTVSYTHLTLPTSVTV